MVMGSGNPLALAVMDELASASGGKSFFPSNAEKMSESFEQIALELRRQYSIGYTPSNFVADGKWRRIKVSVTQPCESRNLIVRGRTGYFANSRAEPFVSHSSVMLLRLMEMTSATWLRFLPVFLRDFSLLFERDEGHY
jgi:hypothetical protein